MKINTLLAFVPLALKVSLTSAAPLSNSTAPYKIVPLEWTGQAFPGGPEISLSGPVEQILDTLYTMNPTFAADFGVLKLDLATVAEMVRIEIEQIQTAASKRALEKRDQLLCFQPGYGAGSYAGALSNRYYLGNLPGNCGVGKGPRTCAVLRCSFNTASAFCNDNPNSGMSSSCNDLGELVQQMLDNPQCHRGDQVLGQYFFGDNQQQNLLLSYC